MWRAFAISSCLVACGGDDAPPDPGPDTAPPSSSALVGLSPLKLGSAYVRLDSGGMIAAVARSDGDWIEFATFMGGQRFGMKLVDSPFAQPPVCVVTAGAGESAIVRSGSCQLLELATMSSVQVRCWDRVMPVPGIGFDTDFTIVCAGANSGSSLDVAATTPAGIRIGGAVLTRQGFVIDPELGNFASNVTPAEDGSEGQTSPVDRFVLEEGVFDDAPNCIANSTGTSSVEIAHLTYDAVDIEPNNTLGAVTAFHTLCIGEHAAAGRVDSTATSGAVLVGATITSTGGATPLGDWIETVTTPSVGELRIEARPGLLPHAPICTCTPVDAGIDAASKRCTVDSATQDVIVIRSFDPQNAAVASNINLLCVAER